MNRDQLINRYRNAYRFCNQTQLINIEYKRAHIYITHDCLGYVMTNKFKVDKFEVMTVKLEHKFKKLQDEKRI